MTDKDYAARALLYLQDVKQCAERVDRYNEIAARENDRGNLRRVRILEENQEQAKRKLDEAKALCDQVGGIEGEILEHKYVCGYNDKTTAYLANYSKSRMRELAKAGRVKLGKLLSHETP